MNKSIITRPLAESQNLSFECSDFYMSEYEAVKVELNEQLKNIYENWKFAIAASAVVFTWLATYQARLNDDKQIFLIKCAWFLPGAVTLLLFCMVAAYIQRLDKISNYIKQIEIRFARLGEPLQGFETFIRRDKSPIRVVVYVLWGFLFAADLVVAYVFGFHIS